MICLLAMVVFGVLGIFSATHRKIAIEAFDCVFRRLTLRKCESGLDQRLKGKITGKLMKRSPWLAGLIFRRFEIISWFFTLLLISSLAFSGYSVYNLIAFGNCNGDDPSAFCVFTAGKNVDVDPAYSSCGDDDVEVKKTLTAPELGDSPTLGNPNAVVTVIEFGCFKCHYTKEAVPFVKKMLEEYDDRIFFAYKDFPISQHGADAELDSEAAMCALEQSEEFYWEYHFLLFENQGKNGKEFLVELAEQVGLDTDKFSECLETEQSKEGVQNDIKEGLESGVYGSPTFFINDKSLVGPTEYSQLKKLLDSELKGAQ